MSTLEQCSAKVGYQFQNAALLECALIHKSFGNEQRAKLALELRNNERMEFLGDAVLDLCISQILIDRFPESTEGDLSKLRAGLVNERNLAKLARELDLGNFISLGRGEELTGGRDKDSILASTFEAIVAAIFKDGGFKAVSDWTGDFFSSRITTSQVKEVLEDYKTRLQEISQAKHKCAPLYSVILMEGPDHDKVFTVQVSIAGKVVGESKGKSKKEAEQSAAKMVLDRLGNKEDLDL